MLNCPECNQSSILSNKHCYLHSLSQPEQLLQSLREATFHCTNAEAKPIVDQFIIKHPDILDHYTLTYLYKQ